MVNKPADDAIQQWQASKKVVSVVKILVFTDKIWNLQTPQVPETVLIKGVELA